MRSAVSLCSVLRGFRSTTASALFIRSRLSSSRRLSSRRSSSVKICPSFGRAGGSVVGGGVVVGFGGAAAVPRRGVGLGGSGARGIVSGVEGGTPGFPSTFGGAGNVGGSAAGAVACGCAGGGVKTGRVGFRNQHELEHNASARHKAQSGALCVTIGKDTVFTVRTACSRRRSGMADGAGELQTESRSPAILACEIDSTIMQLHGAVNECQTDTRSLRFRCEI